MEYEARLYHRAYGVREPRSRFCRPTAPMPRRRQPSCRTTRLDPAPPKTRHSERS